MVRRYGGHVRQDRRRHRRREAGADDAVPARGRRRRVAGRARPGRAAHPADADRLLSSRRSCAEPCGRDSRERPSSSSGARARRGSRSARRASTRPARSRWSSTRSCRAARTELESPRRPASWRERRPSCRSRHETSSRSSPCSPARGSRSPRAPTRRASRSGSRAAPTRAPCLPRSSGGPGTGPRACGRSRLSSSTFPSGVSLEGIRGIRYVEPLVTRRLAFTPSDPLVSKQWYLGYSGFYSSWLTLPSFEPIPVAVIDSGVDGTHPDLAGKDPRRGELRRRHRAHGRARARNLRRGAHRRGRRQRGRHRRARAVCAAPRREGGHEVARDPGGGRGEGDPLGGRQRCARDQHEPRRHPRSARSRAGHVLTARGRRGRVRGHERRRRRRGGRKLRPGAGEPLEVRELSVGAPARPRRQRDDRHGRRPDVLESRPDLQRHRGARAPDPLDPPAAADGPLPRLLRAGVLELRPRRVSRGAGDVVRRAAGECGRCRSAQPPTDSVAGAGHADPPADDRRPRRRRRAAPRAARVAMRTRAGAGSTSRRRSPRSSKRLPERDFYETNDDLGTRAYTAYGSNRRIQATVDFWDDQDDVYAIELDRNQPVYVGLTGADASVDLSLAFWLPQARSIERVADFRYRVRTSLAAVLASTSRTGRASAGRSTSRCACRAPARRATGSRSSRAEQSCETGSRALVARVNRLLAAARRPERRADAPGSRRRSRGARPS